MYVYNIIVRDTGTECDTRTTVGARVDVRVCVCAGRDPVRVRANKEKRRSWATIIFYCSPRAPCR